MYSRKSNRTPIPAHMPEHYSGWAFRPEPPSPSDRPPEPPKDPPRPMPFPPPPEPRREPPCGNDKPSPPIPFFGHLGQSGTSPLSGLDFDEILIIGLILLLGGNGEDNELPLLLALLLFCG